MATRKFTPGPWRLIPPGEPTPGPMYRELIALVAHSPSLYVVLDDGHPLDRVPPGEWEANARLIAAAPRLYEAVKRVDALLRDIEDVCLAMPHAKRPRWFVGVQDMIAVTDGALRKADGDAA